MGIIKNILSLKDAENKNSMNSDMMYELSNKEIKVLQDILLDMYKEINNICKNYNIETLLVGGSALGAIRHKGFIPWDDDLDIAMNRKDYKKFINIFRETLGDRYILRAPNSYDIANNRFIQVFKKGTELSVISSDKETMPNMVHLDIFPIDYAPENKLLRIIKGTYCNILMIIASAVDIHMNKSKRLKKLLYQTFSGKTTYFIWDTVGWLFSFYKLNKWYDVLDNAIQTNKKTRYCTIAVGRKHYFGELLPYDVFYPLKKSNFENIEINLPNNAHEYLKNLYDDYMVIPQTNKREKHYIVSFKYNDEFRK